MQPQAHAPLRIFLSYGHDSNEELVRRIKTDLEKRGHDVWFDKSEIKAGHNWRRSITEGVLDSDRVLSFLSKYSTRDPGVCLDEIGIAIGVKGGNIQTILVENEREVKPPPSISHVQWLDMHDWKEQQDAGEVNWENWYQSKLAEIVGVIESEESRRFAGEIKTLEDLLKPVSSDARMGQLLKKPLVGRTWLFEAIEDWRSTPDRTSRFFWIMGAPGVGKSAFAAHLAHYGRDKVIAIQFCEYDKPDHRDASRVVRTLAFQIATRLPDYRKLLLTLPEIEELDRKNASELFDYLLADPLRHALDGGRARYLIVVDALDEAGGNGRNDLVEMLARNALLLPGWIGLVVTSRPESDVIAPLQGLNPFPLDTEAESNRADIRDYLRRELATHLQRHRDADHLVGQILEKSEGMFLYVERFCDDVRQGHLSLDRPEQFPQGLGGVFFQYFQRQFPVEQDFENIIEPVLGVTLAAREPLPVEILRNLFGWREPELRKWLRILGSLFPVTTEAGHEVIKPHHKSLSDWLTDQAKAGLYFVSVLEGHRRTANFAKRDWRSAPLEIRSCLLRLLPFHLVESGQTEAFSALLRDTEYISAIRTAGTIAELLSYGDEVYDRALLPEREQTGLLQSIRSILEERLGITIHDSWRDSLPRGESELNPFRVPWEHLGSEIRLANRRGAADIITNLTKHCLGARLGKSDPPIEFRSQLESLSAGEHEAWVQRKRNEGWRHGPLRDNANKIHPMMSPWSDMPEAAQNKDRDTYRRLPKLLASCGYEIYSIPPGP